MKNSKYILSFLGFLMLCFYIWFRFIRVRLPSDIPFNLSFLGMLILVFICSIYIYIIYSHINIKNKDSNIFIGNPILKILFIPLKELDLLIKTPTNINQFNAKIYLYLIQIFKNKEKLFVIIFNIIPRIILVLVLVLDIFYFHYLSLFYKFIFLGLFLLLDKYISFSIELIKEEFIKKNKEFITINMKYENAIQIIENSPPEDEDEDDFIPPTMNIPLEPFLEYQKYFYNKNQQYLPYNLYTSGKGFENFELIHNLQRTLTSDERNLLRTNNNIIITNLLNIDLFLLRKNIFEEKTKNIKLFIFSVFLICWVYILIVSLSNLYLDTFFYSLVKSSILENPFN